MFPRLLLLAALRNPVADVWKLMKHFVMLAMQQLRAGKEFLETKGHSSPVLFQLLEFLRTFKLPVRQSCSSRARGPPRADAGSASHSQFVDVPQAWLQHLFPHIHRGSLS